MENLNKNLIIQSGSLSAYDRTYTLPDLEPIARDRRKRSGKSIISAGMDTAVLGRIRSIANGQPITLDHIYSFVQILHSEGLKKSTIRTYIYYCKASIRLGIGILYHRDRDLKTELDDFFKSLIPKPGIRSQKSIPSRMDLARLIALSGLKTSLIIQTLYESGMRISELCWLKKTSIRPVDSDFYEWDIIGKGGYDRTILMSARLTVSILETFNGKKFLFETQNNSPYNRIDSANLVRHASRQILGREIGPHVLRHCFATHMLEDYPSAINHIMTIGGWRNADTFIRTYTHSQLPAGAHPALPSYIPQSYNDIPRYSAFKLSPEFKAIKNTHRRDLYNSTKNKKSEVSSA